VSLRFKMILGIGLILTLVIVEYTVVSLREQAKHQRTVARTEAELISRVADRALSIAMEKGKGEESQALLERIASGLGTAEIRVLDLDGHVLRSSVPGEVGQTLLAAQRPPPDRIAAPIWDYSGKTVAIFRAIRNGPTCLSCHPAEQENLGLLNVRVEFATADSRQTHLVWVMTLSGILGLLLAGVLMAFLFTVVAGRRIDALSTTMQQVEAGDLEARVLERSADELGRLGRSFNVMVARLAAERRQREAQHADEIRQAEQVASLGKMAAVGRLSAGIAHEINNPINNITLSVEAIMEDFKGLADDAKWGLLEDIAFEAERASEIVHSLLDFARQEKPELVPIQIAALIESTAKLVSNEMTINNVTFAVDLPAGLPRILGSTNQLRQVLLNLFLNAIQAMPSGGVLQVSASPSATRAAVHIEVRDEGTGIQPETLPHIFDPFFTTKEPGKGTGLGLWVTYGIVKKHGGEIRAASEPGVGTTFCLTLPAAQE
jgi:signal transduction histidine kinase